MYRVLAIATLTIRAAQRSWMLLSLFLLTAFVFVLLPLNIRGDGTLRGETDVLLHYTLGFAFFLFAIATTAWACTAVSNEVASRRIHMVVTKPVRPHEIWLGHWVGIMAVNAVLLAGAGLATYGALRWTTRPARLSAEDRLILERDILATRRSISPATARLDEVARRQFAEDKAQGRLPANLSPERAFFEIRDRLLTEMLSVPPGGVRRWSFPLPRSFPAGAELIMRYRFATSRPAEGTALKGQWMVGTADSKAPFVHAEGSTPNLTHEFRVPAGVGGPGREVLVEYQNIDPATPATILFYHDEGLDLQYPQGRLETNLLRSLLVMLGYLGFLAALGLTAGSLFHLPVAAFVSAVSLLVLSLGRFIHTVVATGVFFISHHGEVPEMTALDRVIFGLFRALNWFVDPLTRIDPLGKLADGLVLPWSTVARAALVLVLAGGGLLCLAGCLLFRRRELGAVGE